MSYKATILNSSDKALTSIVALGKGEPQVYDNLKTAAPSSIYVDTLNKCVYVKFGDEVSDWTLVAGTSTKVGIAPVAQEVNDWGMITARLQENVVIGDDDVVTGTLKYVNDFTGYGLGEDSKGYFLRLYIAVPTGTTKIVGQKDDRPEKVMKNLGNGILTLKILDDTKKYVLTFTGDYGTKTRTLDLTQLKRRM